MFDAAAPLGLTPPVLTDYLHLSVGGTISVGGIGGATSRFGTQADQASLAPDLVVASLDDPAVREAVGL